MLNTQQAIAEQKKCLYVAAARILALKQQLALDQQSKRRKPRTVWMRQWLVRRYKFRHFYQLLTDLHMADPKGY